MSIRRSTICLFALLLSTSARAGERSIIQLKDFTQTEIKGGGFSLPTGMKVHIRATGGSEQSLPFAGSDLYAYGWIINADTRERVWKMDRDNTTKEKSQRVFDDYVYLPKGDYEVYFGGYGYSPFYDIDRRGNIPSDEKGSRRGFLEWLAQLFGTELGKDWRRDAKKWSIELSVDDNAGDVRMFTPPREFPNSLYHATRLGDNEHIRQRFTLSNPATMRIYAIGENDYSGEPADYGWILDARTHRRIWEMRAGHLAPAGGAEKNRKFDGSVSFPAGDYILYFVTDNSHSFTDWNAPPPDDPFNYGVTLIGTSPGDREYFKLTSGAVEEKNVIVQLIRVGNSETRTASFTLKKDCDVRVYAIGERDAAQHEMADYGWIINAKTREKVWTMDAEMTEPAGGAEKNRMVDEVITLPKGSYTVFYRTDDSHAYNDWNDSPPFDPDHWGITISGEGDHFDMTQVEQNAAQQTAGIIAQIVRVGNNANETRSFHLSKPTHVRIYALGEGQNRDMYDYGWVEDASSGKVVWEMTYSMTFHAGGGRKNRMVNTTILLDRGSYVLHYVSDDSHSYNNWNTDPPDDPGMWGITLYEEQ